MKKNLIFLHIFRTGGNSFSDIILRNEIIKDQWFRILFGEVGIEKLQSLTEKQKSRLKFIDGHMTFGMHKYFKQPFEYMTILREPVDRVISEYYNSVKNGATNCSLDEYIRAHSESAENIQTKMLFGVIPKHSWSDGKSVLPENALEIAKANLLSMAIIGLTERFDETMIITKKKFGLKNVYYRKWHVNSAKKAKGDIPPDTLALIQRANRLDMELYSLAEKIFERQIQDYGEKFYLDLKKFRFDNRLSSEWLVFRQKIVETKSKLIKALKFVINR